MGSLRLRQGPQQRRLAGISLRSTLLGLVLGVGLLAAAPSAASADADLSITKVASPEPVLVNELLTYTITVQNSGPADAATVQVIDTLPTGVTFDSATPSQGTCSEATGTITCALGTLPNAQSATVEIKVRPQGAGSITNQASVSSPDADPNLANNSASAMTTVNPPPSADLSIAMTDVPDPVVAGEFLTYSLLVQNIGPSEATTVSVADALPPDVTFVSATTPSCSEASGTVTCNLDTLASGGSATFDITVRPQNAGSLTNQATVSSAVTDPDLTQNADSVDTTVLPPPSPPGGGSTGDSKPKTGPLNVVLTGSYVLISGRSVKLVKGKFLPVKLTCAGLRKCAGTISVSTEKPITKAKKPKKGKKQKRRVARLGSKKFSIEGNRQQKVLVPLSKSKVKLLKRLKRVKARATIREIDLKGHPRISTRSFMLRAR
jgi:uncharacterized repeat protein (TIGR01451 family)